MDKPVEAVLAKIPADRRRFVQSLLGMAGYAVPAMRSFVMASAIVPVLSAAVTTTRSAWRPATRPAEPLIKPPACCMGPKKQSGS